MAKYKNLVVYLTSKVIKANINIDGQILGTSFTSETSNLLHLKMDRDSGNDFFADCEIGDDDVFEDNEIKSIARDLNTIRITESQPYEKEEKVETNMELCDTVKNQIYFDAKYDAELHCATVESVQPSTSSNDKKTRTGATKRKSTNNLFVDMSYNSEVYEVNSPTSSFTGPMRFGRAGAKRKTIAKIMDAKRKRYLR